MEDTVKLEIPLLLPGVEDDQDGCLKRLESVLENRRGILRAHMDREKQPVNLCLHYDPSLVSLEQVQRMAKQVGAQIANRYHHAAIPIEGMDCSDCAHVLEHSVGRMPGVLAVSVSYPAERMWVEYDSQVIRRVALEKRVRSLGYAIPLYGMQRRLRDSSELLMSLAAGLLVLVGWLGERFLGMPPAVSLALYLGAYVLGSWHILPHAWRALRERHFDIDLLMLLAALGAAVLGEFAEGALLLFLFSLGHALEERALARARHAVDALKELAPKTALVRSGDQEVELPVDELQIGDVVIVRPGLRIPVDGLVLEGHSGVNQAPVTGESLPVDKAPGDVVFAGTVNGEGALQLRVTRLAKDSTLRRVMALVEEAQAQKSPTQVLTERFERVFVPAMLVLVLAMISVPPLFFDEPFRVWFLRAMTLLVAVSPCALALGTPAAVLAGVAQAARNGVLVKGGVHLENLGKVRAVAFDKTGTITHGKPEVTDIVALNGAAESDLLRLAAGVEVHSAHPLGRAIARAAVESGLQIETWDEVKALPGLGLQAAGGGRSLWIGNQALLRELDVRVSQEALEAARALEEEGKTLTWLAEGGRLLGFIALADTIRPGASAVIRRLYAMGIESTVLLTGDHEASARTMAAQAGFDEVQADLMPEDKLEKVGELLLEYEYVAMVGDGVNDAPALALATVGIAMGGAGSDAALESADVALMGDDLAKLPFTVGLGRATRRVIVQNLAIALAVIALLGVASIAGLVGIGMAVLLHEGSTLVVVANALRLLRYKEVEPQSAKIAKF